jgi:hypothetical protein
MEHTAFGCDAKNIGVANVARHRESVGQFDDAWHRGVPIDNVNRVFVTTTLVFRRTKVCGVHEHGKTHDDIPADVSVGHLGTHGGAVVDQIRSTQQLKLASGRCVHQCAKRERRRRYDTTQSKQFELTVRTIEILDAKTIETYHERRFPCQQYHRWATLSQQSRLPSQSTRQMQCWFVFVLFF